MSGMPIYSQVVPKSRDRDRTRSSKPSKERPHNLPRDFDPLNFNHGGNIDILNAPLEARADRKEGRRKEDSGRTKKRTENEGKVEAYLRQNQVSMRQQQRHSARQAEHRMNLRSLPLNEVPSRHERTPTERRLFPGEREREREHRRERDRDRDRDVVDADAPVLSPRDKPRMRKSSSSQRVEEPGLSVDKRRFFCREWLFQKIALCLEQRALGKCPGALILGEAGSGKTAICAELGSPGSGPQARQQRALHRRLLARHLLQTHSETSLRPGEFVRSLAMQILSHGLRTRKEELKQDNEESRDNFEEEKFHRFETIPDDGEEISKPLLADSEDQRTDEEEANCLSACAPGSGMGMEKGKGEGTGRLRTIDRIHEREDYVDSMDAPAQHATDHVPKVLPRASVKPTNPFLEDQKDDLRLYENHENLFLRNVSSRQSKEIKNARLVRQSSEPLTDKKQALLQKSSSTEQRTDLDDRKIENSPPKSRIPVANFRYPNKSELKLSSNESSPMKKLDLHSDEAKSIENNNITPQESPKQQRGIDLDEKINKTDDSLLDELKNLDAMKSPDKDGNVESNSNSKSYMAVELPEYENILKRDVIEDRTQVELEILLEKKRSQIEDVPPPIPSLPVSPRTLIANAYYEKLLAEPEIQQALLPSNLEKNPDECFKRALLFPLLEIDPPKQCLFILVDGIDGGHQTTSTDSTEPSASVAELLSRHQHLLPPWLLLVATARRHRARAKLFTGFRKIQLDELSRAHTAADVQRYVLARLDTEPRLRSRVSNDAVGGAGGGAAAAAAALDHLRIKSDGCLLYLEKVLDGVADGFIALREIREIPGTLNGLYLWLAQRLFHGRRFNKVRLLLEVLLAARCGVTEEMLYKCLLTKEYSVSREDFNRRLHLLRRIVTMERSTGYISIFHHSFACWLLDVKHCTRRYLCSRREGHAAVAMYYTLMAHRLSALEIHNYVYHMTQLEQHLAQAHAHNKGKDEEQTLDLHTLILLWVLDSGADLDAAMRRDTAQCVELKKSDSKENEPDTPGKGPAEIAVPLEQLVPALGEWAGDARVLTELLTLRTGTQPQTISDQPDAEVNENESEEPEMPPMDPNAVFELIAKGDDDALAVLLKRYPAAIHSRDATHGTPLHCAARAGRARAAAALCAAGADLGAADADGWSPLRAAAWAGHPEVVDVLLEYGCDVDCVDSDNRTALRAASWSGHLSVVTRLLSAGANPGRADAEGRTPLMAAAYMGHADIVRALLGAGAQPEHTDLDGRTALSVAALCSVGASVASLLIERGANVNACDRDGATPLLVAAVEGHTELCEVLLEAEADVEAADGAGRTALWAAAAAGHARAVRLLLFWGAQVDNMDTEGRTVLSAAAAQGNVEVVRQLLDRGLDEHHRDNSGWTPLHYAAFEGHEEVCDALLEAGARVDEADNEGKGALLLAAAEGHARLVASLLERWGADVDQRAHDGKTALRLAALEGHFDTVDVLLERGADVDALDADRRSTLYVLALDNRLAMARHLLRVARADPHATDTEGRTPLHVSAWQGHTEMVNLLVKVGGASVDSRDRCARTALHAAAWRGRTHALRALLALGAAPAARCSQGATPLGIAAQEGHEECVTSLLQHGADPLQADHAGRTPAKVAWRAGHANICRLLERWAAAPSAPAAHDLRVPGSPEGVRRSVHSSSTKSSVSHELDHDLDLHLHHDKTNRANLSLSFAQQVARMGRGRRDKDRESVILEHPILEKDPKLRSYAANSRDAELRGYAGNTSPLYASPPRSPTNELRSPTQPHRPIASQPNPAQAQRADDTNTHFNRDTHMRIILGRDKQHETQESKNKRNGIVTNPAMRLVANVRNGLDNAAANIRRTGVALAASASSANPAVKTNAFQWRKETPL